MKFAELTPTVIDALPAGDELDALVAEALFGGEWEDVPPLDRRERIVNGTGDYAFSELNACIEIVDGWKRKRRVNPPIQPAVRKYSRDIEAAMQLLDQYPSEVKGERVTWALWRAQHHPALYRMYMQDNARHVTAMCPLTTAAHAVALAFLKAKLL